MVNSKDEDEMATDWTYQPKLVIQVVCSCGHAFNATGPLGWDVCPSCSRYNPILAMSERREGLTRAALLGSDLIRLETA